MNLLDALLVILRAWAPAFAQSRSAERAVEQALGSLLALGRRTLSRSLWALARQHQDWSADYKLHSRAVWKLRTCSNPSCYMPLPFMTPLCWWSPWMTRASARPVAKWGADGCRDCCGSAHCPFGREWFCRRPPRPE
jgi:hypothetical protein